MAKEKPIDPLLSEEDRKKGMSARIETSEGGADIDSPEGRRLMENSVRRALGDRLQLYSKIGETYRSILKLAVDQYSKKCVTVAKGLKEIGASDLQVNSLNNLVNAGYLAVINPSDGSDVQRLSSMTYPQRDAVRNALSFLHGEYEKVMEKEGTLLVDTGATAMNLEIVQAMFTALLPQKELGEE